MFLWKDRARWYDSAIYTWLDVEFRRKKNKLHQQCVEKKKKIIKTCKNLVKQCR